MKAPLFEEDKGKKDSEIPDKPQRLRFTRAQTNLDLPLIDVDEDMKLNKYHRQTRVIYRYGEHPRRYFIGLIYALQCLYIGWSTNPVTPISVAVANVSLGPYQTRAY